MICAFDRQPAFVLGPRMDVLAGNELAWARLTAARLAVRNALNASFRAMPTMLATKL